MTFFKRYNFPVVFTRAANVYGPGQQLYRIVPRAALFSWLQKKLPSTAAVIPRGRLSTGRTWR